MNDRSPEYIRPLLVRIDRLMAERERVLVAIDGGSASGKTTLGALLQSIYACPVFHMDDFFLRPEQRTPERFSEPGGNVDRERLQCFLSFRQKNSASASSNGMRPRRQSCFSIAGSPSSSAILRHSMCPSAAISRFFSTIRRVCRKARCRACTRLQWPRAPRAAR